jgi:hypothetical protein
MFIAIEFIPWVVDYCKNNVKIKFSFKFATLVAFMTQFATLKWKVITQNFVNKYNELNLILLEGFFGLKSTENYYSCKMLKKGINLDKHLYITNFLGA